MAAQAVVAGISAEAYLQLHSALTKHTGVVQPVTPIEEAFYKIGDLRQLLVLHGLGAGGTFNKSQLLAAIKGQKLINPSRSSSSNSLEQGAPPQTEASELPFSVSDMCGVLGVSGPISDIQFLPLCPEAPADMAGADQMRQPTAAADLLSAATGVGSNPGADVTAPNTQHQPPQAAYQQAQPQEQTPGLTSSQQMQHTYQPQPCAAPTAGQAHSQADQQLHHLLATLLAQHQTAAPAAAAMLQQPPLTSQQPVLAAGSSKPTTADLIQQLLSHHGPEEGGHTNTSLPTGNTAPPAADNPNLSQQATAEAGTAAELQLDSRPGPHHAPWLKAQLEYFSSNGLRLQNPLAAAAVMCGEGSGLLGQRVGFTLLEEMQVAGPRNTMLTLPPGFYEGMTVKYLGSSCQQEVCEALCPGPHHFYRASILPPRALPDPTDSSANDASAAADLAASLSQAQAATSGRPVLLILDLHPRLRSRSLEGLVQLPTAEQLQDAWVLLDHEGDVGDEEDGNLEPGAADQALHAAPAGPQKRGPRKPGRPAGSHKRMRA